MKYYFNCECGKRIDVLPSQAGSSLQCVCGLKNAVPSLSRLTKEAPTSEQLASQKKSVDEMVRLPALMMIVTTAASMLLTLYLLQDIHEFYDARFAKDFEGARAASTGSIILNLACWAYILYGAIRMRQFQDYGHAKVAAMLCLIPCVNPMLGFVSGFMALRVLVRDDVKAEFEARRKGQ